MICQSHHNVSNVRFTVSWLRHPHSWRTPNLHLSGITTNPDKPHAYLSPHRNLLHNQVPFATTTEEDRPMPGAHCPACGTVRGADGCACAHADETALLHTPQLVRPYVTAPPSGDPFTTRVTPPDVFATQLMPPVPPQPANVPTPAPAGLQLIPTPPQWTPEPSTTPDLGVFGFHATPDEPAPGSRAERRVQQQESASRRRTVIIAAGLGIAAIGASLAFVLSPSDDKGGAPDQALPVPVGSYQPTVAPTTEAVVPPSEIPNSPAPPASPSSAKPKATRTTPAAPSPSTAPVAPTAPSAPSPAPTTEAPSPTFTTLREGSTGPEVVELKELLDKAYCGSAYGKINDRYDGRTVDYVSHFQAENDVTGDPRGEYGPNTHAALTEAAADPDC